MAHRSRSRGGCRRDSWRGQTKRQGLAVHGGRRDGLDLRGGGGGGGGAGRRLEWWAASSTSSRLAQRPNGDRLRSTGLNMAGFSRAAVVSHCSGGGAEDMHGVRRGARVVRLRSTGPAGCRRLGARWDCCLEIAFGPHVACCFGPSGTIPYVSDCLGAYTIPVNSVRPCVDTRKFQWVCRSKYLRDRRTELDFFSFSLGLNL